VRLDELGEFGFLRNIWSRLGAEAPGVILGSGDDAAVLAFGDDTYLLLSTDAVVEGRHFRRDWLTAEQIGRRAGLAALSDLAAMGGQARAVLASAALPPDLAAEQAEALLTGLEAAAATCGARLVGGDLTASPGPIFLDVVAVGETARFWPRAGARPGDAVLVSGDLGRSAAALALLESGVATADLPPTLRERFLSPQPAFDLVAALQPLGVVTAAIDLSDGLLADLTHVAEASAVRLALRGSCVPVSNEAREVALSAGQDPLVWAVRSGEEYELAFTVPAEAVDRVMEAVAESGSRPVTVIGEVLAGNGVVVVEAPGLGAEGYDHFAGRG
jgi:thiamine-monophosphate kinase